MEQFSANIWYRFRLTNTTRSPEKIQKELDKYPNLHIISRDRGYSYKAVPKECYHVADRFHLIMNLSETITNEIKNKIPMYINIMIKENTKISENSRINAIDEYKEYTDKQKRNKT